jgi:hypothetical protein
MHAEEALGWAGGFKALHLALSSPDNLMRILGAIVAPKSLLMRTGKAKLPEGSAVWAELVGDQQPRRDALVAE